tara:strand:- start:18251 stop:18739 length:489 start_codon:yes stop_codon:yes gene_type:complete
MHKSTLQKLSTLIAIILTLFMFISCTSTNTGAMDDEDELLSGTVVLENNGAQSYTVSRIDGDGISAETGTANPSITLTAGGRYTFVNQAGASSHPLDFRNGDREKLFGQSNAAGQFDSDSDVNVVENGDSITFTLTESLAASLADYICSFHPGMNGNLVLSQ